MLEIATEKTVANNKSLDAATRTVSDKLLSMLSSDAAWLLHALCFLLHDMTSVPFSPKLEWHIDHIMQQEGQGMQQRVCKLQIPDPERLDLVCTGSANHQPTS